MERGVAAAGEGFPSHQLRSIVHQGATARASFNFRGDGLFDTVNSLAALGSRACAGSQMVHSFDPHVAGFGDVARFAVAMGIPDAAATRVDPGGDEAAPDLDQHWKRSATIEHQKAA